MRASSSDASTRPIAQTMTKDGVGVKNSEYDMVREEA